MPDLTPQQIFELAFSHHSAGRLAEAQSLYQFLLTQNPNHPDVLHLSGLVAHQQSQHAHALELISRAIAFNPNDPAYHSNLAEVHRALHQPELALAALDRALQLKPNYPAALTNRANILLQLHRLSEAEAAARLALTLQPNMPQALHNLGTILQAQNLFDDAQRAYEQALILDPTLADAWNNLGTIHEKQNQLPLAREAYEKAISLHPRFAAAHNHLGLLLHRLGNTPAAITSFDHALAADPNYIDAHWNLSLALLLTGNLARGWDEYEYRWQYPHFPSSVRPFQQPLWTGQPLAGKTILLHAEQGFGDAIHFVRYAALVAERGAKVLLEVRPELVKLFQSIPGIEVLTYSVPAAPILPNGYDFHCPFLSLPRAFGTRLESIPQEVPYLFANDERVAYFKKLLASSAAADAGSSIADPRSLRRIGLVWAGSSAQRASPFSAGHVGLADYAPLFEISGVQFVSLQVGPAREQIASAGLPVADFSEHINDFADTAGLIMNLDLVLTVDTAVAHLAGALGKPTWLLLPNLPDWRWLLHRNDSPWYPTVKLFRQSAANAWPEVITQLVSALQQRV